MSKVLISLVGHQPLPLLLVIKHLQPDKVFFVGTRRTKNIRARLAEKVKDEITTSGRPIEIYNSPDVDPFNFLSVPDRLENIVFPEELEANDELFCDVTGGTKAMSIGLTHTATKYGAKLLYLDSEGADNRLWQYRVERNPPQSDPILIEDGKPMQLGPFLTIQDLFDVYLGKRVNIKPGPTKNDKGARFEKDVLEGFKPLVDEWRASVCVDGQPDIDLILRRRNKFAVVECKEGNVEMKGIQQLNNIASERYLGTYTAKILALAKDDQPNIQRVAQDFHEIHILKVTDWRDGQTEWSEASRAAFRNLVEATFNSSSEE